MRWNEKRPILMLPLLLAILAMGCTGQFLHLKRTLEPVRADHFIMVTAGSGDTWDSLAEKYLKDKDKAWQIAAFNPIETLSSGQRIVIPLVPPNYGGISCNGYQTVPVLLYSEIAIKSSKPRIISVRTLETQLKWLRKNGFVTVSLDQLHGFLELNDPLPPKAVVITFDTTSAWAYELAFPALRQLGMKAAIFISPEEVGQKGKLTWSQLKEMAAAGMESGLYGPTIRIPDEEGIKAYLSSLDAVFVKSRKAFERQLEYPCRYYAYPEGESSNPVIALLKKHGYSAAFTRKPGSNPFFTDNFKIKRFQVPGHEGLAAFRQNLSTFHPADLK